MSEWITSRRPNVDDADINGFVATDCSGCFQMIAHENVKLGDPWYPIPKPYVPPKPKRRELKLVRRTDCDWRQRNAVIDVPMDQSETMIVREVLPTDPSPEEIEEVAAELLQLNHRYGLGLCKLAAKLRGDK